ncbi:glycoside hydrolase superfamily [Aspergillus granulosus]|uniref:chitinase n=1 Tax=Aspergillus granulosus TaxID=176169 RepID=A0ABR4HF99_9EURO
MTPLHLSLLVFLGVVQVANAKRCLMYLTGQHNIVPDASLVADITHVALAFMRSDTFNHENVTEWNLFTTVDEVRAKFAPGTTITVAIGGWGDTDGFSFAARSEESRRLFARNVRDMLEDTGADGVDVDWEYPGGNGEDYKHTPNTSKIWEIAAYPQLLSEIRAAIGPDKLISAAVPGLPRDMLAFTAETIPDITASLDFFNIMTYDLMNRRDNVTKHHTGIQGSLEAIDAYLDNGVPPEKANLGFAFYVKWFRTDPAGTTDCATRPLGCKTVLMEDPNTGADLGQAGAFSWHDPVPDDLKPSFERALINGEYDTEGGGYYFWDGIENLFWSFDTDDAITRKVPLVVGNRGVGGVFAWGLGEDAPAFEHLRALTRAYGEYEMKSRGKLGERDVRVRLETAASMVLKSEL